MKTTYVNRKPYTGRQGGLMELGEFARRVEAGERNFHGSTLVDTKYEGEAERALAKAGIMFPARYAEVMSRIPTSADPDKWSPNELFKKAKSAEDYDALSSLFARMQAIAFDMKDNPIHFHSFRFSYENGGAQPVNANGLFLPFAVLEEGTHIYPAKLPNLTIPGAKIREDSGFSERRTDLQARRYGTRETKEYKVAQVAGMNMVGAQLSDAAMQGVDLKDVNMTHADFNNVDFTGAQFYPTTDARGARFTACDFSGAVNTEKMLLGANGDRTYFIKCKGHF